MTTNSKRRAPAKTATKKTAGTKTASKKTATDAASGKRTALAKRATPVTLVTGGTGFLGAHLVRQLVEAGTQNLRVLATSAPAWLSELGVESIKGSVTSAEDVARAVGGVAEIYHLAGRVSREAEDAHRMYALHVDGTRLVCDAARAAGVKTIVLASTSGTIAVTKEPDITPDEDWPPPLDIISRWPYYASKVYQENVALEHLAGSGVRLVIVNPSLLLGPGDERLSSTRVVLDFLARKIISVPKGGLSFVDVRDAATVFRAAMERGEHGERYLVCAANWTFEKFFARLERLTKTPAPRLSIPSRLAVSGARGLHALYRHWKLAPPVQPAEVEMADYFWYADSSKAERDLGFTPRDPSETLHETVTYVRRNFLGNDAFKNSDK
ncbi:MAG TPA: NAD-dependent epimerase/dehydratase family protein [Pyrinomonadaceae bacterium]|jgi:dihydroflavonol-4-reductase|nr:NAD-dependent epimerase/dehydratase family protein [Pyrinomonadaceae bacterium]